MGVWVPSPSYGSGESVLFRTSANRAQGSRAVGGRLYVTTDRWLFIANRFDRLTGGRDWSCDGRSVQKVGVEPQGGRLLSGGMRRRLRVETKNDVELFVINHLDEKLPVLEQILSGR